MHNDRHPCPADPFSGFRQERPLSGGQFTALKIFPYICQTNQNAILLNLELFIARKLLKGDRKNSLSVPIVRIAVAGIALGICVMLLSIFITAGFKNEITGKLSGFAAHLHITAYEDTDSYDGRDITLQDSLVRTLRRLPGIKQVYPYITKPAILKNHDEIHGVVLKGLDTAYQADFYRQHLQSGGLPDLTTPQASDEILISASVAALLDVKAGDPLTAYFVQEPPRARVFRIKGIYDTGFKEYDDVLVWCDIRQLQRLNNWKTDQISGLAIELTDIKETPAMKIRMDDLLPLNENGDFYRITTLRETAPQIFDWLNLLNMNVWIILILIITVAGFNMVSGLLILILDKTSLIGILKALGYKNIRLKRLFLYIAIGLIGRGMLAGNVLAFLLGGVQHCFRLIRLDATTYYMDTVPVYFDIRHIALLNIGVLTVSVFMLIAPTMLISRIRPIKAIRFE